MFTQVEEDRKTIEALQANVKDESLKRKKLESDLTEKDFKIMEIEMVRSQEHGR